MTRFAQAITLIGCAGVLLVSATGCREAAAINPAPDLKVAKELRRFRRRRRSGHGSGGEANRHGLGRAEGEVRLCG